MEFASPSTTSLKQVRTTYFETGAAMTRLYMKVPNVLHSSLVRLAGISIPCVKNFKLNL